MWIRSRELVSWSPALRVDVLARLDSTLISYLATDSDI